VNGFVLLDPAMLLLALPVPLALLLRRRAPAVPFAPFPLLAPAPRSWRVALLPLPRVLQAAAILLAVVALARPARHEVLPLESRGIDILLCLDASSSMGAADMDGSRTRLDVARAAAARFVRARPHDRIGLVSFARFPDLRCPPTSDHDALLALLAEVATVAGDGPEDATGLGAAAARAAQVLHEGGAASPVVILLTDGEENVATKGAAGEIGPLHAAQLCRTLGVRVYAVAAGGGRGDTGPLARLARGTGGEFFEARDASAVAAVYERIDALEKTVFEEPRYVVEERFLPFLLAAVALLVAGRLLGATFLRVLP
jgi:Ca-activated chloride channel family protein